MIEQKYVVFFSGGVGSAASVLKLLETAKTTQITLLFADTKIEDPDLYRFIDEFSKKTLIPLCFVSDGRTPQQVFKDKRWLGNSRIAPCSHVLKQETCLNWVQNNCDTSVKLIVGIDWSEIHRLSKIKSSWEPWDVLAPLCDPPYWDKLQCQHEISKLGICLPLLYSKGFPHNNCGGACVRGGKAQWRKLLKYFPERFLEWEDHEKEMQNLLQKPVTILKDISLANLREQVNNSEIQLDLFDLGGCGCFMD